MTRIPTRVALAAAALALCGAAQAQQSGLAYNSPTFSVRLYGLIDATIGSIDHANAAGQRKTGFDATATNAPWFSGARWGITGKRSFTDEQLDVIFKLENEYLIRDGSADDSDAAFGRDAWIGVQNAALGKLTFGRQNTVARDFAQIYGDAYGSAAVNLEEGGWTNGNNFKQMIFYAGSASGTRYNNGVVWKKDFGGVVAGLGYQFGNQPGSTSTGSTQSAALAYNGGKFNLAGFGTHANVGGQSHNSYSVGGDAQFGIVRVNAGYFHYTVDQAAALGKRTDNAYTISTKIAPPGKLDYELGYQVMKAGNAAVNGSGNVLRAFADASAATATATGKRSTVYGSVFYHFDSSTEVYFAADHLSLADGYKDANTKGFPNQTEFGVGLRFRF